MVWLSTLGPSIRTLRMLNQVDGSRLSQPRCK